MSRLHQVRVRLSGGRPGGGEKEKGKGGGGGEGEMTSSNASQPLAFMTTLSMAESHFAEYKCAWDTRYRMCSLIIHFAEYKCAWDTRFLRGDCTSSTRLLAPVQICKVLYIDLYVVNALGHTDFWRFVAALRCANRRAGFRPRGRCSASLLIALLCYILVPTHMLDPQPELCSDRVACQICMGW